MQSTFPPYDLSFRTTNNHFKDEYIIAARYKFEVLQADAQESPSNKTYINIVTSDEKSVVDGTPLKPKHQQHIVCQKIKVNEKIAMRNSNSSLKNIQYLNEVIAQHKNLSGITR